MAIQTKTMNKNKGAALLQYFLAFVIPFIVVVLAYIGLHITPFGDKMIVISDAKALYISDLSYISRALRGKEDLLYSFQLGIGMNLMGTHSGLLNPANVIVLLFDITSYPAMYSWLMAIDIAFCGLTMFTFFSLAYGRRTYNLVFSTAYALIGFNVAYCFHFNFLLSVELLPLIALGIKQIMKGKTPWLYLIALSYAILASFYFGYMLCIASIMLFLMWYAEEKNELRKYRKRVWMNYIGASLTAGLLPAFMWVATVLSFSGGRAEQNTILDFTLNENMSFADIFAKLFIGANDINELIQGRPNIFCGSLVVFLVIAFFVDSRNSRRVKLIRAVPLAFYFITFYVKALSMVMQGFTSTNWFNYRYSFVFSFLLILTAFEEFITIRTIESKDFKRTCFGYCIFVIYVFSQRYSFVSGGWMLIDVIILAACLGAIWWNRKDEVRAPQRILAMLLILLCAIEGYANFMVSTNKLEDWMGKEEDYKKDLFYGSVLAESVAGADSSFYRSVNEHPTHERCSNDPRLFGYDGVNYFGSCERTFVFQGMSRLGLPWLSNRMWYAEGLPSAFDALLGLKYVVAQRDLTEEKGYQSLASLENNTVFKNDNALPVGLLADERIRNVALDRNPFENHNNLWKAMTGLDDDVFTQEKNITFSFHANNDGETIDYQDAQEYSTSLWNLIETSSSESHSSSSSDSVTYGSDSEKLTAESIKNTGRYIECTFTASQDGAAYSYSGAGVQDDYGSSVEAMRYLGKYKKGDTVTDYIALSTDQLTTDLMKGLCAEYYIAYSNDKVLNKYCEMLQSKAGNIKKETDSHLTGVVVAGEGDQLFFTIPYDEGWTLTVDGKEAELKKTADLFMSAEIPSGEHSYEMRFFPRGMQIGIYISCVGLGLLFLLIVYSTIDRKRSMPSVYHEEA